MQAKEMTSSSELEQYRVFAEVLADASGEVIRRYFRTAVNIDSKQDDSPVTIADREAEQKIRTMLEQKFPDHGIQGEEFGLSNPDAPYRWIIDPIDGTKSFMIGRPIFGTLIALTYQGKPVLGVIDQPIARERWVGLNGTPMTFNGKRAGVRPCKKLADAVICTTAPELFAAPDLKAFNRVVEKGRYVNYGGDCYSYGLLAMGLVDIVIETGLKPHDYCALAPVVKSAGGVFVDWQGKEVNLQATGSVIALGDKSLLPEILSLLENSQ